MLKWGVIQAWNGSRLNPNGKFRLKSGLEHWLTSSKKIVIEHICIQERHKSIGVDS